MRALMKTNKIPTAAIKELAASIRGSVITAADPDYDEARSVWNAMIDRHPEVIIRAHDLTDIPVALKFASGRGLPLAIRGGGHNVAGYGTVDNGIVLDLRACNTLTVDPVRQLVTAGPGALLGEIDRASCAHDLAVPLGVVSQTGVAGLSLGGGFGWLTRAHGLTADNLLAADLLTPEGEAVHADQITNPELLWGLRGGGGNFGVVTSFTFRAHSIPRTVFAGNLIYRAEHWRQALRSLRDWSIALPDAMTVIATVLVPPVAWELGIEPTLFVGFVWAHPDHEAGAAAIDRFTTLAPPDAQDISPVTWPEWQSSLDEIFPKGVRAYWKNTSFAALDDEVIEVLITHGSRMTQPGTAFDIHLMGGAMGRVSSSSSAFPDRSSEFWINIYGFWNDSTADAPNIEFIRGLYRSMHPLSSGGEYINFSSVDEQAPRGFDALGVYGPDKLARLVALKRCYDPHNRLHLNHNIALPEARN